MVSSKQVIHYLSENLNRKNYVSLFIAGSIPEELIPKSDLDIFIVIKGWRKNLFFENLKKIMNRFVKKYPEVRYSLFRGPLKFKHKGLIHFIVYTEEKNRDYENIEQFRNELRQVLKGLMKTSRVISGRSIKDMTKEVDWTDKGRLKANIKKIRTKFQLFKKKNYIIYKEWKKTSNGWKFLPTRRYASKFFRDYLMHYFKKNIP